MLLPQYTLTDINTPFYGLGPEDFATQYDLAPVYAAGLDGSGQTIGIIGDSNINLALVNSYRTLFKLPASHTQVVIDGDDPGGALEPDVEGFLDVEVSGAIAPNATVNFYLAGSTPFTDGIALAALRAVDDNLASTLSVSYGNCEQLLGNADNAFWAGLWEQAAAQGQTVFVSSGDSGPATCPTIAVEDGVPVTLSPLSVNGISSTPWNVSVGGTDFYYADYASGAPGIAGSWNQSNDSSRGSLKASLKEQPWSNEIGLNAVLLMVAGIVATQIGCGSGSATTAPPTPPPPTSNMNAPAGTYSVLVLATAGGIIHNASLTFTVQ